MHDDRAVEGNDVLDVAIVGFGPVGQALAALLGKAGHRVGAFERYDEIYPLPRAVHLDHEVMRILQDVGVADTLADDMLPVRDYNWFGSDGEPLMTLSATAPSLSGWEPDYLFFQPTLEHALDARARSLATVTVQRGWAADGLAGDQEGVTLQLRRADEPAHGTGEPGELVRSVRARYVVGADGANSFVREALGIERRDLGFHERWLVVDVEPHDMAALDLPRACQWCDPRRPTTHIQSGTRHRRWEFMLLPGEHPDDFADEARVWDLLVPWFTAADGRLTRHAVYEFRSMLSEPMRLGRVLLVGDAAHLTPPFLGQGLCAGLRDASNVAWKLDLVLRGLADEALLDSVDLERQPQNEWIINFAVTLGRALCELDPAKAAERDIAVRAAETPPPIALAPLEDGFLRRRSGGADDSLAGRLAVQGRLRSGGREGLLDELTGGGFTLIARDGDPLADLSDERLATLAALDATPVSLDPDAPHGARDLDGRTLAWLDEHGVHAVIVRPDFYVFGSADSPAALPALVDDLRAQLRTALPSAT